MSSENQTNHRRSLRLRYKTTEILFDPNAEKKSEVYHEDKKSISLPQTEEVKEGVTNYSKNASSDTVSKQNDAREAVLHKEQKIENVQLEFENLRAKLSEYEGIMENQQHELENVKNLLANKTKEQESTLSELNLAKELIAEKRSELNQEKEKINKEDFDKLKIELRQAETKYTEISTVLVKEREQNDEIKEELLMLKKDLLSSLKMEKQLESFVDQESAKTRKLEKQLTYLLNKYNSEREHLYNDFRELQTHSKNFFDHCENHCKNLSEAVDGIHN